MNFLQLRKGLRFIFLLFAITFANFAQAQLILDNTQTVEYYVNNYLLGGGVIASNITFNGAPADQVNIQVGSFLDNGLGIGAESGLVMGTLDIDFLNDFDYLIFNADYGLSNDPDLILLGNPTACFNPDLLYNNQSIIEFDFLVSGDSVSFNYVFGSEEYGSFTCSSYNDVFGFFLSGPGISGIYSNNAVNIARIPGTETAVGVNTLNSGNADGDATICGDANPNWLADTIYFVENEMEFGGFPDQYPIKLGGFTKSLLAGYPVTCGEQYHIKLAIGNACDNGVNSAVFLEAGSFTSSTPVVVDINIGIGLNDSTIYDGCGSAELTFTRSSDTSVEEYIYFSVGGTAINGVDYTPAIPDSLVFAVGDSTATFTIDAVLDAVEGLETIEVEVVNNGTECTGGGIANFIIYIAEAEPLNLITTNYDMVDCNDSVQISGIASGGYGFYLYSWNNGNMDSLQVVSPEITTTYFLTLSDTCDAGSVTQPVIVNVPVNPPLVADAGVDITLSNCEEIGQLLGSATGGLEPYNYSWTIETEDGNEISTQPNAVYSPSQTSQLVFTVNDACEVTASDFVTVNVVTPPILITTMDDTGICLGENIDIWANAIGGQGNLTAIWSGFNNVADTINVAPKVTTTYTVSYTDECETEATANINVQVNIVKANFSMNYLDYYGVELSNTSSPDDLNYAWDFDGENSSFEENPTYFFNNLIGYQVTLTVQDSFGCIDTISQRISPPLNVFIPNSFSPNNDGINDLFFMEGVDIKEIELRIFNRWGETVFESYDLDKKWNGTGPKGEFFASNTVFTYKLKVLGSRLQLIEKMGTITLVR